MVFWPLLLHLALKSSNRQVLHTATMKSQEFHPSLALLSRVGQTAPEIQVAVVTFRYSLDRSVTVVGELFLEHFTT